MALAVSASCTRDCSAPMSCQSFIQQHNLVDCSMEPCTFFAKRHCPEDNVDGSLLHSSHFCCYLRVFVRERINLRGKCTSKERVHSPQSLTYRHCLIINCLASYLAHAAHDVNKNIKAELGLYLPEISHLPCLHVLSSGCGRGGSPHSYSYLKARRLHRPLSPMLDNED